MAVPRPTVSEDRIVKLRGERLLSASGTTVSPAAVHANPYTEIHVAMTLLDQPMLARIQRLWASVIERPSHQHCSVCTQTSLRSVDENRESVNSFRNAKGLKLLIVLTSVEESNCVRFSCS